MHVAIGVSVLALSLTFAQQNKPLWLFRTFMAALGRNVLLLLIITAQQGGVELEELL